MKIKKIILGIIGALIVIGVGFLIFNSESKNKKDLSKMQVVSSNFASYDFLRAIIGKNNNIELSLLVGAGKDTHSYDPTTGDLITIQNADLFVYIGGEMEKWANKVISSIDTNNTKVVCIADFVDKIDEEEVDGAEAEEEKEEVDGAFDEHIWTSPANAIKMVNALKDEMVKIDDANKEKYEENAKEYIEKIKEVDGKLQEVVDNKKRDRLVFGDKMPMQYFINYYKLKVSAAFNGCSTETEPSASTIAYLENKVREEKIPVVLYIELNNGKMANTIASDVGNGVQTMQIQSLHNVSLDDFKNGETWVSLMTRNIEVLKKALQ